ncbi:MAG: hypothetical protein SGJ00_00085 [bacterium]|nr:hypothetical protein [bacterium]
MIHKITISIWLLIGAVTGIQAQVKIGNNPTSINSSAILEMESTNKGLLIPRVSLTSNTDVSTITSATTSLLVYNTATAGSFPANVVPGYYYWNGTKWVGMSGPTSTAGVLGFAKFYALMPTDNNSTVAVGSAVEFPNTGPTSATDITKLSSTTFQLASIGTYSVCWQVSVAEAGQLLLKLNSTEDLTTVVGRATGTSLLIGNEIITTTTTNSVLSIVNPTGNSTALTITPFAGGSKPVAATLIITRIQ